MDSTASTTGSSRRQHDLGQSLLVAPGARPGTTWRCLRPVLRDHDVDPAAQPDPRLGRVSLLDYAADLEAFVRGLGEPGWQEIAAFVAGWLETRTRGRP